jgi:hypothetical protein
MEAIMPQETLQNAIPGGPCGHCQKRIELEKAVESLTKLVEILRKLIDLLSVS